VEALNVLRSSFHLTRANRCLEHCDGLLEGLQVAGMDTKLSNNLHGFNDWIQRALIELSTHISTSFFPTPPPVDKPVTQPTMAVEPKADVAGSHAETPGTDKPGQSQTQNQTQSQS
jgi:hypothetical protein